jgi:multidrug efflux pump subunit AcrA (membrane-fusion protein)
MRKTKKRLIIWLVVILLLAGIRRVIPEFVRDTIPSIYYITPSVRVYENTIQCSGTLQTVEKRQIILESAVIPQEIRVSVGDRVNPGEVLATCQPTSLAGIAASLPRLSVDRETISALLSAYGLNTLLGEAGLNGDDLAEYLEGSMNAPGTQTNTAADAREDEIVSPIAGVITSIGLSPYIPAGVGNAAFTIMDTGAYMVTAAVGEGDISKLSIGDDAVIRGAAFSGSVYRGKVSKVYPTARKSLNGTVTETVVDVEILLENADSRLKPGFSAKVEIIGRKREELVTVPYEAVRQDENNNEYVYTYLDGRLTKSGIITGQELSDGVEVLEGVARDSIVIYNPDDIDREGTMIHLRGRADAA